MREGNDPDATLPVSALGMTRPLACAPVGILGLHHAISLVASETVRRKDYR